MTEASSTVAPGAARMVVMTIARDGRGRLGALLPSRSDLAAMGRHPRQDVIAGLTVAVVALPLGLAFGISSGLGAEAGLATAIVAGVLASLFGGSNLQVSGPTGAMTVVLVPIFAQFGANGVLVVGLLAGAMLTVLAVAGAGRAIRYIPLPVIEGFTIGIAVIIAVQQVPAALGVTADGEAIVAGAIQALGQWLTAPDLGAPAITLFVGRFHARRRPAPARIADVPDGCGHRRRGRGRRAPGCAGRRRDPGRPADTGPAHARVGIAGRPGHPAVAVAALAALESLLSATVADGMRVGERHDPDRELFGQGIANLVVPLFGGIPATAAIARTAVNVRAGARSRLAAGTQSIALLLLVAVAAPMVGAIPLAALAGVLIATAIQMIEVSSVSALLRSTRGDALTLITTAAATIILDLVAAVILGLVVAGTFALRQVASSASLAETEVDHGDHSEEEQALFRDHIVAYRLEVRCSSASPTRSCSSSRRSVTCAS
jgi:sulfate permease, SulP family